MQRFIWLAEHSGLANVASSLYIQSNLISETSTIHIFLLYNQYIITAEKCGYILYLSQSHFLTDLHISFMDPASCLYATTL